MSQKVIIVIGMPGSGKSSLMKELIDLPQYRHFKVVDNVYENYPKKYDEAQKYLRDGYSLIVSDIQFCNEQTLNDWKWRNVPTDYEIEYIYFSNEPEICKENAIRRNGQQLKRQLELIEEYTKFYRPVLTMTRPVWKEKYDWNNCW